MNHVWPHLPRTIALLSFNFLKVLFESRKTSQNKWYEWLKGGFGMSKSWETAFISKLNACLNSVFVGACSAVADFTSNQSCS